jgi:hypothetical protein
MGCSNDVFARKLRQEIYKLSDLYVLSRKIEPLPWDWFGDREVDKFHVQFSKKAPTTQ